MLKQLMISKKIEQRKAALAELEEQEKGLETRAEQVAAALAEAQTDEEIAAVEEEVSKIETEKEELKQKKASLEAEIAELEGELEQLNSKEPKNNPPAQSAERNQFQGGEIRMKRGFFQGINRGEVESFINREDVKDFLTRVRSMMGEKRAVTGAELTIPDVMLDLLRDNLYRYSKLITKVRLKTVGGKARQNIMGAVPEGVWTEAIGKLNELALAFNQVEVDGYKVGGFIPVPNSTLEDSDLNLANEILDALGQALGLGIDKAILYGTGTKMPVGIATRLAQITQPSDWGTNTPAWTNLSTTNLLKFNPTNMTSEEFFAELVLYLGVAKPNYSTGGTFWAMNRQTRMKLLSKAITFNAAGAVVAGLNGTMPVEGGDIVELPFIPNNDIIGGYGELYLLAERAGASLAVSEHAKFIEDQTVFRGTARYDGKPVFGEGFVIVNIANTDPITTVTFASDTANTANT